jgi:molybdenum cofactor cytidylyltransferase
MGTSKLLLPWGDGFVIDAVLTAWRSSRVSHVLVVVRADDHALAARVRAAGATVVAPLTPPPQMRDSVEIALRYAKEHFSPTQRDVWLLAPADNPLISTDTIHCLLAHHDLQQPQIVVPAHQGRRGHPVLFPWGLSEQVFALPADQGIDVLVRTQEPQLLQLNDPSLLVDLDTPEQYAQWAPNARTSQ